MIKDKKEQVKGKNKLVNTLCLLIVLIIAGWCMYLIYFQPKVNSWECEENVCVRYNIEQFEDCKDIIL